MPQSQSLICATAIYAPLGLKDRLFHVWRRDGKHWATVELKITGGRAQGYRTHSRIHGFGLRANGKYTCTVQTLTGQVLGTRAMHIGNGPKHQSGGFPLNVLEPLYTQIVKRISSSAELLNSFLKSHL